MLYSLIMSPGSRFFTPVEAKKRPCFAASNALMLKLGLSLTAFAATSLSASADTFNYSGSIVNWTVPAGANNIHIEARGAQGGFNTASTVSAGLGAVMSGDFTVTPGAQLKILVGEQPNASAGNGGGGGTFVTDAANTPLIVAGGGGGSSQGADSPDKDGQAGTAGGQGAGGGGAGGTNGNGGSVGASGFQGGAGGGLLTNGADGWTSGTGGAAFVNGGAGSPTNGPARGGFGGGGSGSSYVVGGGGGGYSGGGGGGNSTAGVGGGGGSFNAGINQLNTGGANTGNGQVIITVQAGLSISNATATEGNSGLTDVTLTVTLSQALTQDVTVDYATGPTNGYVATADEDYVASSGTLTFFAGETSKDITVQVKGDTIYEGLERFAVNLSNISDPIGVVLVDGEGIVTIKDDDAAPSLSINDVVKAEGNVGDTGFPFTVSLSGASGKTVTVKVATVAASGNPATGGSGPDSDYTDVPLTTLSFAPGETSKTVTVQVKGDTLNERDERFVVKLSGAVNAQISDSEGVGTIANDDALPSLSINDVALAEGDAGTTAFNFTVTLSAPSGQSVTVKYATATPAGNPATAGIDYTAVPLTTLTFAPGQTTRQVTVLVNGETTVESYERFAVKLSSAANATIFDSEGFGTILNDDVAPTLLFEDGAPSE